MCQDTFEALGLTESILSAANVKIHGTTAQVYHSRGHFEMVNLLGQDYLRQAKLHAVLNYDEFTTILLTEAPNVTLCD